MNDLKSIEVSLRGREWCQVLWLNPTKENFEAAKKDLGEIDFKQTPPGEKDDSSYAWFEIFKIELFMDIAQAKNSYQKILDPPLKAEASILLSEKEPTFENYERAKAAIIEVTEPSSRCSLWLALAKSFKN